MDDARGAVRRETSAGGVIFRRLPDGVRFLLINDSYRNWGFPKGHVEPTERPEDAARREIAEETGLEELVIHGPIGVIDWFFRFRGRRIHKFCHFFLVEALEGRSNPQRAEGITACRWLPLEEALSLVSYANAREILREAGELVRNLVRAPGEE